MKLSYRLLTKLSIVLLPLLTIWSFMFYFDMVEEVIDETDDALEDFSETIIMKFLASGSYVNDDNWSNISYSIKKVDATYAKTNTSIIYHDEDVYIPEKKETEPARVITTIFMDKNNEYYELKVSTPTFEKDDILQSLMIDLLLVCIGILFSIILVFGFVLRRDFSPFYKLLNWLDSYKLGHSVSSPKIETEITEFKKLNRAVVDAVDRANMIYERQNQFIGNASHELQTPLAVIENRIEWMTDHYDLPQSQMEELYKIKRTINHAVRLNKTLLLLTKIENKQFTDHQPIDILQKVQEQNEILMDIYAHKEIKYEQNVKSSLIVTMDNTLASILVSNLIRNAYMHTAAQGRIYIEITKSVLIISNSGEKPLNEEKIFDRFYQEERKEGSSGLGLSLVISICELYKIQIHYEYKKNMHEFTLKWT